MSPLTWNILGAVCFLMGAAIAEALVRIFSDNEIFRSSIFRKLPIRWFLRSESWRNVYKRYPNGELIVKYFNRLNFPIYAERFLGSSTLFAWLFDALAFFSMARNALVFSGFAWFAGLRKWELVGVALSLLILTALVRHMTNDLFAVTKKPSK